MVSTLTFVKWSGESESSEASDTFDEGRGGRSLEGSFVFDHRFDQRAVHSTHQSFVVVDERHYQLSKQFKRNMMNDTINCLKNLTKKKQSLMKLIILTIKS
jgi:hypothetical protein